MGHGSGIFWSRLFSFSLCGFYEKHTYKTTSKHPLGTPLLSEESGIFEAHTCDPRRRPGSSFEASLHVQNIWQHWTPACAGDHGKEGTLLGDLCDLCAKDLVHAEDAESAERRPWNSHHLPEELAIFICTPHPRAFAPQSKLKKQRRGVIFALFGSRGGAKTRRGYPAYGVNFLKNLAFLRPTAMIPNRLGSSFKAPSLAQNTRQSWTPACAGIT
jgi:hypothetical protein